MGVAKKALKLLQHREVSNVQKYLQDWNKKLQKDEVGNLYLINPSTPLVCAHMDTVRDADDAKKVDTIMYKTATFEWDEKKFTIIEWDDMILGADDRAWVAIAMELYEKYWDQVSLLFTIGEESGGVGSSHFCSQHEEMVEQCTYGIIPDRKGDSDLICSKNDYGTEDFEKEILKHLWLFGFESVRWVWSDADKISRVINCFNISVGYYNQHTCKEYLIPDEMEHTLKALCYLIEHYNESLPKPEPKQYGYGTLGWYSYCWWAYDDGFDDLAWYGLAWYHEKKNKVFELDWPILEISQPVMVYNSEGQSFKLEPDQYYIERIGEDDVVDADTPRLLDLDLGD